MATSRISNEPAFVLHRHDWSETSLILEVFTRNHGRMALVAKGVKRPSSSFRPILLPLQPLHLAFGGDAEIKTLKAAEWQGGHVMPTGDALMSGLYLNELLLHLLAREDPHPLLFDVYASVVQIIASEHGEVLESALRAFELLLLREIGLLPLLDAQTLTLMALHPQERYSLVPEGGLRQASAADRASLSGAQWTALQQVLDERVPFTSVLRACAEVATALKPQLRTLLNYHCGVTTLRTRQMMVDLQNL
ncbi:DNA repair protein RecO [Rhodoferax sp.]|uniref:DNA repair protein RecO n=1 Tax=Rhodoferax sp. TaxID=50421 RepID=UPI0026034062|nr:DNA repair protein RecO [Rhodoferax sp.]MDD2811255.1 DNA repair protein RecO [Rhodoferax sp.]MDD4944029.1 DNA repair protein RecO [Rhodoferax sp.]